MSPLLVTGTAAVAVLVVGWLLVAFMPPGPKRVPIEWISATAMYVALTTLFFHLGHRAWVNESRAALVAFGFLFLLFGAGAVVALVNTIRSLGGSRKPQISATN